MCSPFRSRTTVLGSNVTPWLPPISKLDCFWHRGHSPCGIEESGNPSLFSGSFSPVFPTLCFFPPNSPLNISPHFRPLRATHASLRGFTATICSLTNLVGYCHSSQSADACGFHKLATPNLAVALSFCPDLDEAFPVCRVGRRLARRGAAPGFLNAGAGIEEGLFSHGLVEVIHGGHQF